MRTRVGFNPVPTKREFDVLYCVARDMTNPEIAEELHISEGTVKQHVRNLFDRLCVHTRTGLVIAALLKGHIKLEDLSIDHDGLIAGQPNSNRY